MKIAALFAGQGAQKTGMGKSLYEASAATRDIYDRAEAVMPGISALCFEGAQEELNKTENTQPCVFVTDMACWAAFCEQGISVDAAAGFSLGEYAALCAAGVLGFEDTLKLVVERAGWMSAAAAEHPGGMAAVLGKTAAEVEQLADSVRTDGVLVPVNYNCPGQTVVAGDADQLDKLIAYAKENKIKCMKLPVSGAFHTERMAAVSDKIYSAIEVMDFAQPAFALYANKTALPYEAADMKRVLADQSKNAVRFEQTIKNMLEAGFDTFIEFGPGNTLTGFVKRTSKEVVTLNINSAESLAALSELK